MGMRDTQKLLDKLEYRGRDPKEVTNRLGEERLQKILRERGTGWNGVRAIAQDCVT
jgi:hypothetical protein